MDHSKYEILCTVLEEGSFSAAAEKLGYTPSGMNRMMSALENDFGFPILKRNKKGVALTDDGERLMPIIQKLVYWKHQLEETVNEIKGLETGNINIGTIYSIASTWLPYMVERFKEAYPNITVSIIQGSHHELNEWLELRKVDFIFTTKRGDIQNWMSIRKDPLIVWVSKKNVLSHLESINREQLEREPFIEIMPGQDTDTEYLMNKRGLHLNVQYTSRDNYTCYRMAEAGLGISINNLMMSQNWNGEVAEIPLDPPSYVELGVHFPDQSHWSPSSRKFLNCVKKYISSSR